MAPAEVRKIETEATYPLRSRVLRPGLPVESCHFPEDARSVHFGVFSGGELVSVLSAHPEPSPRFLEVSQWRIRGMATESSHQGRGFGGAGLRALLAYGREQNVGLFWCNAREAAIPFYARNGFQVIGELFDIPGVGLHKVMWVKP